MEGSPNQNQDTRISEQEKIEQNRITLAKNMIQMQLALKKGFDGSDGIGGAKDPEHFFERYSKAFGDLVKANPSIIDDYYTHQDNLEPFIKSVELQLENALPPHLNQ
jgi:hypothetical protein